MTAHNMSTDTYRTPGRAVDETEIEREKVRQAAETKRKDIEEREATKREALKRRDDFGYIVTRFFFAVAVLGSAITVGVVAYRWVEAKAPIPPTPCIDTVRKKDGYGGFTCERGDQVMLSMPDEWRCQCPRQAVAPAHSGAQ